MTAPKLATRHYCSLRDAGESGFRSFHTARSGKPRSRVCTYCRGALTVVTGLYGVFVWRGDCRYPLGEAVKTFTVESRADAFSRTDTRYVVRWVPVEAEPEQVAQP